MAKSKGTLGYNEKDTEHICTQSYVNNLEVSEVPTYPTLNVCRTVVFKDAVIGPILSLYRQVDFSFN